MFSTRTLMTYAAISLFTLSAMGCASTKENTTNTEDTTPIAESSVGSDEYTTKLDDLTDEYKLFNADEIDPVSKKVIVRQNYPVAAIYFDFDVATLDRANTYGVERAYRWLENNPDKGLVIIGHADKTGSLPYNQRLALERAQAAGKALMNRGVDGSRLVIVTHGEEHSKYVKPEYNRRVVFMTDPANAYGVNEPEERGSTTIRVVAMNQ